MPKLVFKSPTPVATPVVVTPMPGGRDPIVISFTTPPAKNPLRRFTRPALVTLSLLVASFSAYAILAAPIRQPAPLLAAVPLPAAVSTPAPAVTSAMASAAPQQVVATPPSPGPEIPASPQLVPLPEKTILADGIYTAIPLPDNVTGEKNNAGAVPLLPLLQKLPLNEIKENPAANSLPASFTLDVKNAPTRNVLRQADEAAASGRTDDAIRLYAAARKNDPYNASARHNLAAMLLEKAGTLDEAGETARAIQAYQLALAYCEEDVATAKAIRGRMAYLKGKL